MQLVADRLGEVDDGVAAQDQVVRRGPRLRLQQVADVEARHLAQLELGAPAAVDPLEPDLQQVLGSGAGVVLAEQPQPGPGDHALVDVGALDRDATVRRDDVAERRQRVGLGAVGAAGAPRADLAVLGQLRQQPLLDHLPLLWVAPEL